MTMRRLVPAALLITARLLAIALRAEPAAAPVSEGEESKRPRAKPRVPVGARGVKLFRLRDLPSRDCLGRLGARPVNVQLLGFYNAVTPENRPNWQLQFLFPK